MAQQIRTAVIGLGHFGRFHVEKYARLAHSKLVAVVDAMASEPARSRTSTSLSR